MAKQAPNRTKAETLSLRISPDLKFGLELLSRVEERSLTTEVEKALRELFANTPIDCSYLGFENGGRVPDLQFEDVLDMIYSPDAPTRLIRTSVAFPHLLNQKEKVILELLRTDPNCTFEGEQWEFFPLSREFHLLEEMLNDRFKTDHIPYDLTMIRKNWAKLNEVADFTLENGHFPHEYSWLN